MFGKVTPGPDWGSGEHVLYFYLNNDTEYPPDSEIPLDSVRNAAHEYLCTGGRRPTGLVWYPTAR